MLFNSIDFAVFLPLVFFIYWFIAQKYSLKWQNVLLLIASYIFYGWWDWRLLSLLVLSSTVNFFVGIALSNYKNKLTQKKLLFSNIIVNISLLGFFKYYNFFLNSFVEAFQLFGYTITSQSLNIILPIGISFYTFQALSYSIDIYRGKQQATKDIIAFFAFVSFFPQLVAGPIERATNLLPQFLARRSFSHKNAVNGMRQILWGLFKKIVIADNCAVYVNDIFENSANYSGSTLLLGAVLFSFQIYGDFSGYSDIAIGTSRLFGFQLSTNFAYPYFSKNIIEFWRRWHISLSSWFKDYIYIPLGGNRGSQWKTRRNILFVFILSGLWHGANWHFIIWGLIHASIFMLLINVSKVKYQGTSNKHLVPSFLELAQMSSTFILITLAWVFFRADNTYHAITYLQTIFSTSLLSLPEVLPKKILLLTSAFILIEWLRRSKQHPLHNLEQTMPTIGRWLTYYFIVILIIFFQQDEQEFIYFKF